MEHYWPLDKTSWNFNEVNSSAELVGTEGFKEEDFVNWALLGNGLDLNSSNLVSAVGVMDENFTLSMWVKPEGNFKVQFSTTEKLDYNESTNLYILNEQDALGSQGLPWVHLAISCQMDMATLYVDGRPGNLPVPFNGGLKDLNISSEGTLSVDEIKIFGEPLLDPDIRYLAGRTYLDLLVINTTQVREI